MAGQETATVRVVPVNETDLSDNTWLDSAWEPPTLPPLKQTNKFLYNTESSGTVIFSDAE